MSSPQSMPSHRRVAAYVSAMPTRTWSREETAAAVASLKTRPMQPGMRRRPKKVVGEVSVVTMRLMALGHAMHVHKQACVDVGESTEAYDGIEDVARRLIEQLQLLCVLPFRSRRVQGLLRDIEPIEVLEPEPEPLPQALLRTVREGLEAFQTAILPHPA